MLKNILMDPDKKNNSWSQASGKVKKSEKVWILTQNGGSRQGVKKFSQKPNFFIIFF